MNAYSHNHANCHFWMTTQVLRVKLKSANERMTFYQKRKKDHGIKVLLEKLKMAVKVKIAYHL